MTISEVAVGDAIRAAIFNAVIEQFTPTVFTRAAATIASSGSFNAVALGTAVSGGDFSHSAGVYTCLRAGVYEIRLTLSYAANATANRGARLLGSGSLGNRAQLISAISAGQDQTINLGWIVTLVAGDTITAQSFQNSGSSLSTVGHIIFDRLN